MRVRTGGFERSRSGETRQTPPVEPSSSESFITFLDKYEADVLSPRELAKGTLGLYAAHFRLFRKQLED